MADPPAALHPLVPPTIWGLNLAQVHDRFWASRGVQVVRPGGPAPSKRGPELFLLLSPRRSVEFPIGELLKKIAWLRPRAVRLRLTAKGLDAYDERVERSQDGEFLAFRRLYNPRNAGAMQVWMTPSYELALGWNRSKTDTAASRWLRDEVSRDDTLIASVKGHIFNTDEDRGRDKYWRFILQGWETPQSVVDGVYQPEPDVWIHETCEIDPEARIIGPAWIGAGNAVGAGETVVGPVIVPDQPLVNPDPGRVDWWDVTHSGWRLIPSVRRRPIRNVTKRLFDIVVSLGVLAVTMPFYPLFMLLIWREDPGNPFFIHTRQRYGGRVFGCIKFRSMRQDADAIKAKLMMDNLADGPQFFMDEEKDPRLLRCGRWMRRYKIDELPQFINVLLGHMSLVGPRPSPDGENQYCPAWREQRLSVRPGITGLWQVASERKPQTDFQEWIRYDLEYVQTNSWRLDLAIIFATVKKILT
ncbi:MAG: sugar transferase [Planctomycetota bacterium]